MSLPVPLTLPLPKKNQKGAVIKEAESKRTSRRGKHHIFSLIGQGQGQGHGQGIVVMQDVLCEASVKFIFLIAANPVLF